MIETEGFFGGFLFATGGVVYCSGIAHHAFRGQLPEEGLA